MTLLEGAAVAGPFCKKKKEKKEKKKFTDFPKSCLKFTCVDGNFTGISAFLTEKTEICSILKFLEMSQRKFSNFSENCFPKVRKNYSHKLEEVRK